MSTTSSWRSRRSARTTSCGARAATTRRTSRPRAGVATSRRRRSTRRRASGCTRPTCRASPPLPQHLGVGPGELLKCIVFDLDGRARPSRSSPATARSTRSRWPRPSRRGRRGSTTTRTSTRTPSSPVATSARDFAGRRARRRGSARLGEPRSWVTGANEVDHHVRDAVLGRDFEVHVWADLVTVVPGDPCPSCGSALSIDRGIEVGQVFQLGTKYSEALDAALHRRGRRPAPDGDGLLRHRHLTDRHRRGRGAPRRRRHRVAGGARAVRRAPRRAAWEGRCRRRVRCRGGRDLRAADGVAGITVLYDDRDASPGVKFADADLLGMPIRLTLGAKGFARGVVERQASCYRRAGPSCRCDDVVGS